MQKENSTTNSIDIIKTGEIALGKLYTIQGGYKLLNLFTGCLISQWKCTLLHMPKEIFDLIDELSQY